MKKIALFICFFCSLNSFSQSANGTAKGEVQQVIETFLDCLETRDTGIMKTLIMEEAQIWRRFNNSEPAKISLQTSEANIAKMHLLPDLKELPLSFEILIGEGIATTMVPYEFWLEGKLSHCGINVFTLVQSKGQWKITNITYTAEKEKCVEKLLE